MKAVIFDMDGVLVDSERQWKLAAADELRRMAPGWSGEDDVAVVGLGVVELHEYLERRFPPAPPREEFLRICDGLAGDVYGRRVTLAECVPDLLDGLAAEGVKVGLASSSPRPWVRRVLDRFGLASRFAALATGDETPGRVKPHPDLYLLAASRLGAAPAACVAVEDSRYGVAAAKAAGMRCLGLRTPDNEAQDLSAADGFLDGLCGARPALLGR